MSQGRPLEAPHRRPQTSSPRIVERTAIVGYKATAAVLAHVPPRLSEAVIGTAAQGSYLLWPAKRRFSNANFGHVLGLPPEHPRVRRLALRAYREYARYVVELMRLPSRPQAELVAGVEDAGVDRLIADWRASGRPMIVVAGHVGSNEAVGAALAGRGYPVSVIADDSSYPELFELLSRQREDWGVKIIAWRNLRGLYSVLKRKEILALLVDWGYRSDGIPVRLFGTWTTLPAGPAALAAKSGAMIAPLAIRRIGDGRVRVEPYETFTVPSSDPADIQRATQRIADALESIIALAPEQWYSFKPMWPDDPAETRALEARATALVASP
ncbi:MAG TPA: lysophospholipid acyltransferase family protein [Candidatus Limnocylindrales bacterium]